MKKVRIFAGSRIELHGKEAELIIKENTSIGHNFHLICGGKMTIGNNTTIASNVFVNDIGQIKWFMSFPSTLIMMTPSL